MNKVLVYATNSEFSKKSLKDAIRGIDCDRRPMKRSMEGIKCKGSEKEKADVIFTLSHHMETVKEVFEGSKIKIVILEVKNDTADFSKMSAEELGKLTKAQIDTACKENTEEWGITYASRAKAEVIADIVDFFSGK